MAKAENEIFADRDRVLDSSMLRTELSEHIETIMVECSISVLQMKYERAYFLFNTLYALGVIDSDECDKAHYKLGVMHDIRYNQLFGIKTGA